MKCYEMLSYAIKGYEKLWNVLKFGEMLQNVMKWHEMLRNVVKCHEMLGKSKKKNITNYSENSARLSQSIAKPFRKYRLEIWETSGLGRPLDSTWSLGNLCVFHFSDFLRGSDVLWGRPLGLSLTCSISSMVLSCFGLGPFGLMGELCLEKVFY